MPMGEPKHPSSKVGDGKRDTDQSSIRGADPLAVGVAQVNGSKQDRSKRMAPTAPTDSTRRWNAYPRNITSSIGGGDRQDDKSAAAR